MLWCTRQQHNEIFKLHQLRIGGLRMQRVTFTSRNVLVIYGNVLNAARDLCVGFIWTNKVIRVHGENENKRANLSTFTVSSVPSTYVVCVALSVSILIVRSTTMMYLHFLLSKWLKRLPQTHKVWARVLSWLWRPFGIWPHTLNAALRSLNTFCHQSTARAIRWQRFRLALAVLRRWRTPIGLRSPAHLLVDRKQVYSCINDASQLTVTHTLTPSAWGRRLHEDKWHERDYSADNTILIVSITDIWTITVKPFERGDILVLMRPVGLTSSFHQP